MPQGCLTQSDPMKCGRLTSPALWMHQLSAQCWSHHTVSGEQGGNFCSFTTSLTAGAWRRHRSAIPGSQLCSHLSSHPQGHCASSAHILFSPTDFFILSPQFLISPPNHSFLPPVQSFAWMELILPFPFSPSSPAAERDQQSKQLTLIHTGVSQNPSPASFIVGTGIGSCPALGESTGTAGGIAPT